MTLIDLLLTIAIISLSCLGLRTLLSDGQILHFIRRPFESDKKMMNFLQTRLNKYKATTALSQYARGRRYKALSQILSYWLKPFVLCVVCFSSVWGGSVFIALHGITLADAPYLIIACVSSSFVIKIVNDHVEF